MGRIVSLKLVVATVCLLLVGTAASAQELGGVSLSESDVEFANDLTSDIPLIVLQEKYPPSRFEEFREVQKKLLKALSPEERSLLQKVYGLLGENTMNEFALRLRSDLSYPIENYGTPYNWGMNTWESYLELMSENSDKLKALSDAFYEGNLGEATSDIAHRTMLPPRELSQKIDQLEDHLFTLQSKLSENANIILMYCLRAGPGMCDI